jgi:hypothetical protein
MNFNFITLEIGSGVWRKGKRAAEINQFMHGKHATNRFVHEKHSKIQRDIRK